MFEASFKVQTMSQKGNQQSLYNLENKEDENAQIHKDPSSRMDFTCEVIEGANAAQSGDILGYFVEVAEIDQVPLGASGCYIPKDRPNRLDIIEKQLKSLIKSHFDKFRNLVVQLGNALQHAVVLSIFPDGKTKFNSRYLTFDSVLKCKTLSDEDYIKFLTHPLYQTVAPLTIHNDEFIEVSDTRNADTHPERIELFDIQTAESELGEGEMLRNSEKLLLNKTKAVFERLSELSELNTLISKFNQSS